MSISHLTTELRGSLERIILSARRVAEIAVSDELVRLGVSSDRPPTHLSDEEKHLRRRLRAHARSLGDSTNGCEEMPFKLKEASAYVHWHRLLFARFLAERNLLINPDHKVPVSLDECWQLANEDGCTDTWEIAIRYASLMLPGIFEKDDPVLELKLEPQYSQKLQEMVMEIDSSIFQADDSIGWAYQFWRTKEREIIKSSEKKIGRDELPAVTQFFTEPYMVKFLLHNTIGAWWANKCLTLNPEIAENADSEEKLRVVCSLDGYEFSMLRFSKDSKTGRWSPLAGNFQSWPSEAKMIKILDPCCGSGHFLTESLTIVAKIRMQEENISISEAVVRTLKDNLYGLEIDGRCVQIAAFSVVLAACKLGSWNEVPNINIAWVGAPPPLPRIEFVALATDSPEMRHAFAALYDIFALAPELGSLIDADAIDLFRNEQKPIIESYFSEILSRSKNTEPEHVEGIRAAHDMMDAAFILFQKYNLILTNVPYLKGGKQSKVIKDYCQRYYRYSKNDLATTFMERIDKLLIEGGLSAIVTQQKWLIGRFFKNFREIVLENSSIKMLPKLGMGAFEQNIGGVTGVNLQIIEKSKPIPGHVCYGMEMEDFLSIENKAKNLINENFTGIEQEKMINFPSKKILFSEINTRLPSLSVYANYGKGSVTGDRDRYIRKFWEIPDLLDGYELWLRSPVGKRLISGRQEIVIWNRPNHDPSNELGFGLRGNRVFGNFGIAIGKVNKFRFTPYFGEKFDDNIVVIQPKEDKNLEILWEYCISGKLEKDIRKIDKSVNVTAGTFTEIPFDMEKAKEVYNSNTDIRQKYSNDPSQWLFHGHPLDAMQGTTLHVILARLCGYRWPAECSNKIEVSEKSRGWVEKINELPDVETDGLLCIPPVATRISLIDLVRNYLSRIYNSDRLDQIENRLINESDNYFSDKQFQNNSLENWLRERAFKQHCILFNKRPFLWQISDGLKDGFSVFVNYHKFDNDKFRKLVYTLLGDWNAHAKADNEMRFYEKGRILEEKLIQILEGEKPFDIFVRWKSLEDQPFGWNPDLEDGVRQNIRPFIEAGVLNYNLKGILKKKDKGKNLETAPWYHLFNVQRINDHHTSLEEKSEALKRRQERDNST